MYKMNLPTRVYELVDHHITVSMVPILVLKMIKMITPAHLLVGEYVYEVEERERSGLENQFPADFRALPRENQKLVSGSV